MKPQLEQLVKRIHTELSNLELVAQRIQQGSEKARRSTDDLYLDGVALNLHGLYSGVESLFEMVAVAVDISSPQGEHRHIELLNQMATEVPQVRPAVISEQTRKVLDKFRGFRHVVRNVYTFNLNAEKLGELVDMVPSVLSQLRTELLAFADFLEQSVQSDKKQAE